MPRSDADEPRASVAVPAVDERNDAHSSCLGGTEFLDVDHPAIQAFTAEVVSGATSTRDMAGRLFAAVRDQVWYDPYSVSANPEHYRASHILATGRAYCVPKAVLLTAVCRAAGIPARLGFADVRNHLQTDALRELMGTDLFVFHGYSALQIDGRWLKATPAFNTELCARFGVPAVDFDGSRDALLHAFTSTGSQHMEYVHDHGTFDDLPLERILGALRATYGAPIFDPTRRQDSFDHDTGAADRPRHPGRSVQPPSEVR